MKTKASTSTLTKFLCAFVFAMFVLVFANTTTWAAPAKVTGLKQTDAHTTSVDFSWTSDLSADYYRISVSSDGKNWIDKGYKTSASAYLSNLSAGQTYYIRICAYNADSASDWGTNACISGDWSDTLTVVTKPDTATTKITGTKATTNSLSFKWAAVSGVDGYQVKYYAAHNSNGAKTINTTKNSCTLSKLSADTNYYIYVYAYKKGSTYTAVSSEYKYVYTATLTKKVKGLKNNSVSSRSAYFTWDSASSANGYELQMTSYSDTKFKKKIASATINSYYSGYTLRSTKIKGTSFYSARIRPYVTLAGTNKKAYGSWSSVITFGSEPKNVSAKRSGSNIKISWDKISGATGYEVWVSTTGNTGYKKVDTVKSNKTSYTLKKNNKKLTLKNKKTYYICIKPIRKVGKTTYKTNIPGSYIYQRSVYYYKK